MDGAHFAARGQDSRFGLGRVVAIVRYLLGSRTRTFFDDRSSGKPWFAAREIMLVSFLLPALVFGSYEARYQTMGPESRPPLMFAEQLRVSPGAEHGYAWEREHFSQLVDAENLLLNEKSEQITDIVRERFSPGSTEAALISTLTEEGFYTPQKQVYYTTTPDENCIRQEESAPLGTTSIACTDGREPDTVLECGWWRFDGIRRDDCTEGVRVVWEADPSGIVVDVTGEYIKICAFMFEPRHW